MLIKKVVLTANLEEFLKQRQQHSLGHTASKNKFFHSMGSYSEVVNIKE